MSVCSSSIDICLGFVLLLTMLDFTHIHSGLCKLLLLDFRSCDTSRSTSILQCGLEQQRRDEIQHRSFHLLRRLHSDRNLPSKTLELQTWTIYLLSPTRLSLLGKPSVFYRHLFWFDFCYTFNQILHTRGRRRGKDAPANSGTSYPTLRQTFRWHDSPTCNPRIFSIFDSSQRPTRRPIRSPDPALVLR